MRWRRHGGQPAPSDCGLAGTKHGLLTVAVEDLDSTRARFSRTGEQQESIAEVLYDAATRGPVMDLCVIWRSRLTGVCVVVRESRAKNLGAPAFPL